MTGDELDPLRAWAAQVLEREIRHNTPAAKAKRERLAGDRAIKKEYLRKKRSLAAQHSARMRALRKAEAERQADMERRRWDLLTR